MTVTASPVDELRTTIEIRRRAAYLLTRARDGGSAWFTVDDDALPEVARTVAELTCRRFSDLRIPFHSRWRHFEAGGVDRTGELRSLLDPLEPSERVRAMIDLTVVSVLLDAGAGPQWQYREARTGQAFRRSEGLGVASWHAFVGGLFSSDPDQPLRVDAAALSAVDRTTLATALQVSATNRLAGFDGRVALLRRLGAALERQPEVFGTDGRPGGIYRLLVPTPGESTVGAHDILTVLLSSLSGIWLASNRFDDQPLGDCWPHPAVPGDRHTMGWMPFHKLSQWLTYSLLEPFQWSGTPVHGIDELTGLPEYRNGGLFLDTGVLALRDSRWARRTWVPGDELVVEWRALTVALLDELAAMVREYLDTDAERLPLACVLEGGSWAAGRALAQQRRDGLPPLTVVSDGTVF